MTWVHDAITVTGNTVRFYRNGAQYDTGSLTLARNATGSEVTNIGRSLSGPGFVPGYWLGGGLADVAVYSSLLSPARIAAHHASGSYPAEVLSDSPVGYWRLNETTGTTAFDSSGNGYDGTYHGGFTLGGSGPHSDLAVVLDGTTGYADIPNHAALAVTGDLTLEWWVNRSPTGNYEVVISCRQGVGFDYPYEAFLNLGDDALAIQHVHSASNDTLISTLTLGQWHVGGPASGGGWA